MTPDLTPEELEALQKSDPAAFDMDDEVETTQVAADVDDDEGSAEQPRDENGRFAAKDKADAQEEDADANAAAEAESQEEHPPKPTMVPKPRLDEVIAERNSERERVSAERAAREVAERRAQELEAKLAEATKQPERDWAKELEELEAKYDDGETDLDYKAYQKLHRELELGLLRAEVAAENARKEAEKREAAERQAQQENAQKYDDARVRFFSDEANQQLANTKTKEAAFRAAIDEVFEAKTASTYDELFAQAADIVRKEFGIGQQPAAKPDPHAARNARDATNASAASNTPPQARGGVGNRGTAEDVIDVSKMKAGSFSKLPKDVQERLLGENAL